MFFIINSSYIVKDSLVRLIAKLSLSLIKLSWLILKVLTIDILGVFNQANKCS